MKKKKRTSLSFGLSEHVGRGEPNTPQHSKQNRENKGSREKVPSSLLSLEGKIKALVSSQANWKGSYTGRISKPYRVGPSRARKCLLSLVQRVWNLIHNVSEKYYVLLHRSNLFMCSSICRAWEAKGVLESSNISAQVLSKLRLHTAVTAECFTILSIYISFAKYVE